MSKVAEYSKSLIYAVVLAMLFRSFLYEPFHIPSGSMKPSLLVGDYIFVSKFSYGYSRYSLPFGMPVISDRVFADKPERGDVAVFKLPFDTSVNYIKRIIGLPGDTIQVVNGVLFLNGKQVVRKKIESFIDTNSDGTFRKIPQYIETLPNGASYHVLDDDPFGELDNTDIYEVPEGHYFAMGDNRDNSLDSRVTSQVGFIPEINLVGKANIIFFSTQKSFIRIWEWFGGLRLDRFFKLVH